MTTSMENEKEEGDGSSLIRGDNVEGNGHS